MAADLTFDDQLGKTAGLDSLESSWAKGSNSATHLMPGRRVAFSTTVGRASVVYQGPYAELLKLQKSMPVGTTDADVSGLDKGSGSDTGGDFGDARISSSELVQGRGNVGTLTVQYTQNFHRCMWSIDFVEVSKPILTWHADKEDGAPDLAKIREWKKLATSNQEKYWEYKIYENDAWTALTGDTLLLAQFIAKGIENYPRYAPCVTCTLTIQDAPQLQLYPIGEVGDPQCPYGWTDVGGRTITDILANLKNPEGNDYKWVRTASKASPNSDGTFTWTMSWQAADSIEEDLYT